MKKLLLLACMCIAFTLVTKAQTQDLKWSVGLHGGVTQYNGDLGNDFYSTNYSLDNINYLGGITFSRYLGNHLDLSLMIDKGKIGYTADKTSKPFSSGFTSALLNLKFNILGEKSFVRPFIFLGAGAMVFDKNLAISNTNVDYATPSYGAGVRFKLGSQVNFTLQETFIYSNNDKRDGVVGGQNDSYLFHTAGFSFNFGKKKDADNDGVADRIDKCPNTPAMVAVDKTGCPLDKDKDGVADYIDACPDVAGTVALNGCPDKDGDGVADKDDQCPDVAGLAKFQGCPDTDGDGIADKDDKCPTVAGLAKFQGCPDTDGDGVSDADDKCPNTKAGYKVDASGCAMDNDNDGVVNEEDRCPNAAGPASLKGCPDTDGDGVADIDDRCPAVKGTMANKGCPQITKEEVTRITQIGSKVFFENNSDKLKVASLVQLDELAKILNRNEGANLIIDGYTDSNGDPAKNVTLSQKRTESVKNYLVDKGIAASRVTASGHGEENPIASNKTALGRAKNRRVELKTTY
ncbi:OmpA family protein [Parasediminibacterium sp. JCM 36343]|uniref:OmpA family protein n=1 Tax=Parasediminibacterium sp. JCM 36343 TaxID=3374279 RepID=UPI0039792FA4